MPNAALVAQTCRVNDIELSPPAQRRREAIVELAHPATFEASAPGAKINAIENTSVAMYMMRRFRESGVAANIAHQRLGAFPRAAGDIS